MIDALSHVGVWVDDQDEAKAFYTETLGFEVRQDATLEEFGGYRWLTVGPPGQPDVNIILSAPVPPAIDPTERLLRIASLMRDQRSLVSRLSNQGNSHLAIGQYTEAIKCFHEVVSLYKSLGAILQDLAACAWLVAKAQAEGFGTRVSF